MNKFSSIVIVVLLVLLVVISIQNRHLNKIIKKHEQSFELTGEYLQYFADFAGKHKHSKEKSNYDSERLRELLQNYPQNSAKHTRSEIIELSEIKKNEFSVAGQQDFIPNSVPIEAEYVLSQYYSESHPALDFAATAGTKVFSAASGRILSIYDDEYFGNSLIIDHLNGYFTFYAHLKNVLTKKNMFVQKAELIATVGNTGNSTAPHLHLEIIKKGENLDPEKVLNGLNRSKYGKK